MAFLSHPMTYPMRPANKEPQWATVYDDLFDQYVDTDHFDFGNTATSCSSDEASNETANSLEGLTNSSDSNSSDARRASDDFWARTLQSLEESASSFEQDSEQRMRQTTPPAFYTKDPFHADFLSLGGFPSPHISSNQTSPSEAAARRRKAAARYQTEYQDRRTEKPVRVTKTYRSGSKSPKMMTPSRYRPGFKDVWAENLRRTPSNMIMNLPMRGLPLSPPSSGGKYMMKSTQYCSPQDIDASLYHPYTQYDEQVSPLSSAFPQAVHAHLHTPGSSPLTTPGVERGAPFGEPTLNTYYEPVSHNRTAWAANSFDVDDVYEPSPTFSPWLESERRQSAHYSATNYTALSTSASMPNMHSQSNSDMRSSGLMISYDPTLIPSQEEEDAEYEMSPSADPISSYYMPTSRRSSTTPSPPSNRHRNSRSRTRRSSGQTSPRPGPKSAFVNYTPSDSEKLLTGVAPSGSSKTKARREREAAEKRRRFSQAAVKAVVEAGGDVQQLKYAGVF